MTESTFDISGFQPVEGYPFPVYASAGGTDRARQLADRTERVVSWLTGKLPLIPTPPLFVLGPADWDRVALIPQYGLAHVDSRRIVAGQEPAPYWNTILDQVWADVPPADRRRLHQAYGDPIDLSGFADLVIAHELSHLGEDPWLGVEPRDDDRRMVWFHELLANVGMHGYVTENEPEQAVTLDTICDVVWRTPASHWPVTALERMADALVGALDDGANYVWFEYGLLTLARRLWKAGGAEGFRHLHDALDRRRHPPTQRELINVVSDVDPITAGLLRRWPSC